MKSLFFVFLLLAMTAFAQIDTLDRVDLKNNQTYAGKVVKITSNTVQLRESLTKILYEFNKSEIKDLRLSNGVTLTFDNTAPPAGQQQQNVTGSARGETQTQNPPQNTTPPQNTASQNPPAQNPPAQNPPAQNTTTQNQPVQNPPAQNPPASQNTTSQNQAVGSGRTQTGNTGQNTQTTTGSQQTEKKQPTENRGQNTQNAAAPADEGTSGLNTSQIIMLAAGGLVVLLLIGALIF